MSNFFPKVATADLLFPPSPFAPLRKLAFALSLIVFPLCATAQSPQASESAAATSPAILAFIGGISLTLVAMYFIVKRFWAILRVHKLHELQLCAEKETITREKEIQQRFYANFIHEVIKGEAQCLLVESRANNNVRDHLAEFVNTCELGQTFVDQNNNNLFDLMKNMEFIFSNRLHSEMEERCFYCEIDPALKGVTLDYHQKYELIFFLRECLNNIRKYAGYKHSCLKIRVESVSGASSLKAVLLEIKDDGIGFQQSLGVVEPEVEITEGTLPQFYKKYLQNRHCTGIREIFRKAALLKGKLTIYSSEGQGTSISLRFYPQFSMLPL